MKTLSDLDKVMPIVYLQFNGDITGLQEMLKPNPNKRSSMISEYIKTVNKIQNCD